MTASVSVIAGLGNPGSKYEATRHNAGFWFVDRLARQYRGLFKYDKRHDAELCRVCIEGQDVWLLKPQSYVNNSGGPIRSVLDYYRIAVEELLVVYDEIDLPVATLRLKKGGGHGGHNGLRDVIACLGREFVRLRIGVGHPGHRDQVVSYVLRRAPAEERRALDEAIEQAAESVPAMVRSGIDVAMNRLNRKAKSAEKAAVEAAPDADDPSLGPAASDV